MLIFYLSLMTAAIEPGLPQSVDLISDQHLFTHAQTKPTLEVAPPESLALVEPLDAPVAVIASEPSTDTETPEQPSNPVLNSPDTTTTTLESPAALPSSQPSPATPPQAQQGEETRGEASNTQNQFEQIFGEPQAQSQQVIVPLFIDGQEQGQVLMVLALFDAPDIRVRAALVLETIAPLVRPDIQEQLTAAVDEAGNLSLEALRQVGLEVLFDQRVLELHIQIPPALKRTNIRNLQATGLPPEAANALSPSHFSGYINLRGAQDFVWSGEGRQPLRLDLDGVINVDGLVLEGSAAFSEDARSAWTRGDLRLVRDDPNHATRYMAGDLSIPATSYQSSLPMLGIAVVRNFALQPYRSTRPISRFEFFLERPAEVEVLINGRSVQTLQLPAGAQDIRDLPLNAGINDVGLIITDDLGQVQQLSFPAAVTADLLAPGVQQFAYSLGVPSQLVNNSYAYDWDQPTLSLFERWGVDDDLTLGGYLQANPTHQLLGVEGIWATSLGNFGWDMAASHHSTQGSDYALRLRYDYFRLGNDNPTQRTLRLGLEYRGDRFVMLGESDPSDYGLDLSVYYSQLLFDGISGSLSGQYRVGRSGESDTNSLLLGLSRAFDNGLSVNLNLSYSHSGLGQDEQRASLNLFWLLPRQRQSIVATAEASSTGSPTSELTWNYSSARTIGGIDGSVGLSLGEDSYGLETQLNYSGYRANLSFSQDFELTRGERGVSSSMSRLTFGTALAFADGRFGWSRPIDNSFALVIPQGNLSGQTVGVNPTGNGYIARADAFGSAVVPGLQPYYLSTVRLDIPDLPIGYDIGAQSYTLLPTYRSGTVVQVGTDAVVFLRGVLLSADGAPVSLQAGEIVSLSDADLPPVSFFTNRAGRFTLMGFKPGQYELRLLGNSQAQLEFEIPPDQAGLYDIGILQFPVMP